MEVQFIAGSLRLPTARQLVSEEETMSDSPCSAAADLVLRDSHSLSLEANPKTTLGKLNAKPSSERTLGRGARRDTEARQDDDRRGKHPCPVSMRYPSRP